MILMIQNTVIAKRNSSFYIMKGLHAGKTHCHEGSPLKLHQRTVEPIMTVLIKSQFARSKNSITVPEQNVPQEKELTTVGFEPTPFRTGLGNSLIPAP